uniref:Uncharacterized protein n=1 Tax=Acrobeloides nanus TaxID=290746 RepID=A0A914E7B5_9BILA
MLDIFKDKTTLIGCSIGFVAGATVGFSGITVLSTYTIDMLMKNGLSHFQGTISQLFLLSITVVCFT